MSAEISSGHKSADAFRQIAQIMTGRTEAKRPRRSLLSPLLAKLGKRQG
jgi:pilus assembly protein CpaE